MSGVEIGGMIYRQNPNWFMAAVFGAKPEYVYDYEIGNRDSITAESQPNSGFAVAGWHTHGNDFDFRGQWEWFSGDNASDGDFGEAFEEGLDIYVGTPRGKFLRFRPGLVSRSARLRGDVNLLRRHVEELGGTGTFPTWDGPIIPNTYQEP